ncbi:MAG: hypothetical protein NNA18_00960 [Nitrospira sp.]|nr:hypothetical protein [Nitrospira sp.]
MPQQGPCQPACTKIIKFMTDHDVPPSVGISLPPYTGIDGYRHINMFVRFSQTAADEPPVDLGVIFAFDAKGTMGARRYVNLEENLSGPQSTTFIEVSGRGSWHGSPYHISSYVARFPVMGPFVSVFGYSRALMKRKVSVGDTWCRRKAVCSDQRHSTTATTEKHGGVRRVAVARASGFVALRQRKEPSHAVYPHQGPIQAAGWYSR